MTDDLVKQLREYGSCGMVFDAADRIEQDAQHIDEMYGLVAAMNVDHTVSKARIEKLETALREIAQTVTVIDEDWHPSYHDSSFTQKQAEGLSEALAVRIKIARKALEGKDD